MTVTQAYKKFHYVFEAKDFKSLSMCILFSSPAFLSFLKHPPICSTAKFKKFYYFYHFTSYKSRTESKGNNKCTLCIFIILLPQFMWSLTITY
jgi:hypothetical protein